MIIVVSVVFGFVEVFDFSWKLRLGFGAAGNDAVVIIKLSNIFLDADAGLRTDGGNGWGGRRDVGIGSTVVWRGGWFGFAEGDLAVVYINTICGSARCAKIARQYANLRIFGCIIDSIAGISTVFNGDAARIIIYGAGIVYACSAFATGSNRV